MNQSKCVLKKLNSIFKKKNTKLENKNYIDDPNYIKHQNIESLNQEVLYKREIEDDSNKQNLSELLDVQSNNSIIKFYNLIYLIDGYIKFSYIINNILKIFFDKMQKIDNFEEKDNIIALLNNYLKSYQQIFEIVKDIDMFQYNINIFKIKYQITKSTFMDLSTINELKQKYEPLKILFEKIEVIRPKVIEETYKFHYGLYRAQYNLNKTKKEDNVELKKIINDLIEAIDVINYTDMTAYHLEIEIPSSRIEQIYYYNYIVYLIQKTYLITEASKTPITSNDTSTIKATTDAESLLKDLRDFYVRYNSDITILRKSWDEPINNDSKFKERRKYPQDFINSLKSYETAIGQFSSVHSLTYDNIKKEYFGRDIENNKILENIIISIYKNNSLNETEIKNLKSTIKIQNEQIDKSLYLINNLLFKEYNFMYERFKFLEPYGVSVPEFDMFLIDNEIFVDNLSDMYSEFTLFFFYIDNDKKEEDFNYKIRFFKYTTIKDLNLYKGIKFMYTDKMTIDNIYKQIINFQKLYISNKSIKSFLEKFLKIITIFNIIFNNSKLNKLITNRITLYTTILTIDLNFSNCEKQSKLIINNIYNIENYLNNFKLYFELLKISKKIEEIDKDDNSTDPIIILLNLYNEKKIIIQNKELYNLFKEIRIFYNIYLDTASLYLDSRDTDFLLFEKLKAILDMFFIYLLDNNDTVIDQTSSIDTLKISSAILTNELSIVNILASIENNQNKIFLESALTNAQLSKDIALTLKSSQIKEKTVTMTDDIINIINLLNN